AVVPLPLMTLAQTAVAGVPPETLTLSSFWGLERIGTYFWPMTLFFLKVGSAIFGGGLVIIPFIAEEVVEKLGWLTAAEFLDGVAIGQFTPGPVVLTAAFIGYKVAGVLGALTATVAIFAPSFAFILLAAPVLLRIRRQAWVQGSLQAIMPTALGAIAAATIPLAQNALSQETPVATGIALLIGGAALVGLMYFKLPTWLLVLAGGGVGLLVGGPVL
ncbi:MAG: chromate transporter, partial [Thermostichus sp. DG02_5_bins_236]